MAPRKRARPNPAESSAANTTSLPVSLVSRLTGSTRRDRSASQPNDPAASTSSIASSKTAASSSPDDASQSSQMQREPTNEPQLPPKPDVDVYQAATEESQLVARETIMGGTLKGGALADFSRYDTKRSQDTSGDSDTQSIKTLSKIAESESQSYAENGSKKTATESTASTGKDGKTENSAEAPAQDSNEETTGSPVAPTVDASSEQPATSSGWFGGWLGGSTTQEHAHKDAGQTNKAPAETQAPAIVPVPATPAQSRPTNSWFGWVGYGFSATGSNEQNETSETSPMHSEAHKIKEDEDLAMTDAPPTSPPPAAGSTWAFWSRDSGSNANGKATTAQEQGELAIMGDGSESSPQRSAGLDVGDTTKPKEPPLKKSYKDPQLKGQKSIRPEAMDIDKTGSARPNTPTNKTTPVRPDTPTSVKSVPPPNLLLPAFRHTHLPVMFTLLKSLPRIKKAIAIGVHGLFPASFLRPVIGQPTGTSIRFANHAAEAIRRWADSHGCADCEIEKVALEGEGKIGDRVDNLWKLLLNWIDHIRKADLILLACHSQGVPVGVMLVAKLIDLGIITTARIGICAMAGVCLGPFPDYKSGMGMLMGSAAELWQFSDPESEVSKRYEHSLRVVLERGTRITYIGSIDDQLVPMESAVYSPASHPYIYRAVFIDGRLHAPDFIAHLVGFALKLRNLGISDQGLIRELSVALAGSLYSGEGHSRLYDDETIYDLSVSHALETTIVNNVSCNIEKHTGLTTPNPYVLPWIMRGLLEEDIVKTELSAETADLLKQFDDWKPVTKALKDIKFRLEAVRSKL
ncbi:uncharacterized protein PG998_005787 [Apiospora kogelbergensis]|uniref:uncharacterized protein n=1 Tax=Apiospora kogelbergensis TaxID=1337665 RepID=UPI0031313B50